MNPFVVEGGTTQTLVPCYRPTASSGNRGRDTSNLPWGRGGDRTKSCPQVLNNVNVLPRSMTVINGVVVRTKSFVSEKVSDYLTPLWPQIQDVNWCYLLTVIVNWFRSNESPNLLRLGPSGRTPLSRIHQLEMESKTFEPECSTLYIHRG